jgi:hypothetical protein
LRIRDGSTRETDTQYNPPAKRTSTAPGTADEEQPSQDNRLAAANANAARLRRGNRP